MLEEVYRWNPKLRNQKIVFENILVQPILVEQIRYAQEKDPVLQKWWEKAWEGKLDDHCLGKDGILRFWNWIVIPNSEELKWRIFYETHRSKYMVHPNSNKIYQDLKKLYCWDNMKRKIASMSKSTWHANKLK